MSSDPHSREPGTTADELAFVAGPAGAGPLLPIELAIAEEEPDRDAREFIAELVDVREELSELFDSDD